MRNNRIIVSLYDIGAVKIDFEKGWTLKSGIWSPIYVNLRLLQSYPALLRDIAEELSKMVTVKKLQYDRIASIPLAAVPLGIAVSMKLNVPHILPRMDSKKHGLGVKIDGVFEKGQRVLLIDDLITKATSKLEAISELVAAGLTVTDVVVVLDREQGGNEELEGKGYRLLSLFLFHDILKTLQEENRVSGKTYRKLTDYLGKSKKP